LGWWLHKRSRRLRRTQRIHDDNSSIGQVRRDRVHAIAEYEASMREYAFAAVADSLKAMKQFTGEKKYPAFSIFKTGMRVVNAMPTLKNKLIPA
jgi:hypothetical protein